MSKPDEEARGSAELTDLWRQWYEQSERIWSKTFEQTQSTEAYAALQAQMLKTFMESSRLLRDQMTRSLETMNVASREDFARLAAQVVALEGKIDDLDEKLDKVLDHLAASPAPEGPARPGRPSKQ